MSPEQRQIGVGVVGCGGFGLFALQHFAQVAGVRLVGMAETHREAAQAINSPGLRIVAMCAG